MSDDLNFTGNELNYFTTYFNVGCTYSPGTNTGNSVSLR